MLKQRILTAISLLPVVVVLILYAPLSWLALMLVVVVGLAAYEWAILSGYAGRPARYGYTAVTLLICVMLYISGLHVGWNTLLSVLAWVAAAWWLSALILVVFVHDSMPRPLKSVCGWLTLVPALFTAVAVADARAGFLLWMFCIIWAADIGAYFAGKAFGRHKLAPVVSPGKTWEGVAGGTLAMIIVAIVGWFWLTDRSQPLLLAVCVLTGWISIVGDLSESLFKRQAGVKDSGTLFPGHGGALDRVDSLTAAAPFFWLGLKLVGWHA